MPESKSLSGNKPIIVGIVAVLIGSLFVIPNPIGPQVCDLMVTLKGTYKTVFLFMGDAITDFSVITLTKNWRRQAILDLFWGPPPGFGLFPTKIGFDVYLIDAQGNVHGPYKVSQDIPALTVEYPFAVDTIIQSVPEGSYVLRIRSSMQILVGSQFQNTVEQAINVQHGGV